LLPLPKQIYLSRALKSQSVMRPEMNEFDITLRSESISKDSGSTLDED